MCAGAPEMFRVTCNKPTETHPTSKAGGDPESATIRTVEKMGHPAAKKDRLPRFERYGLRMVEFRFRRNEPRK